MAQLPNSGLEQTPAGSPNVGGLVNGNWQIIDDLLDPSSGSTAVFKATIKQSSPSRGAIPAWGSGSVKAVEPFFNQSYSAVTVVNVDNAAIQKISLTGDIDLSLSEKFAGMKVILLIQCDSTARTITLPSSFHRFGDILTIPANKYARIEIESTGATDSDVFVTVTHEN